MDIATAQRIVAREFPNPSLALGISKISVDGQPNNTSLGNGFWGRSYDSVATVSQLIEIGGKRPARKASAAAGLRGAEARLADARRLLDQAVAQAYVAAALAERSQRVLSESGALVRQEATIAELRQRAGDISLVDKMQIEIAADRLDLDARTAEAGARNARVALEVLLGVKQPQGELQLAEDLEQLAEPSDSVPDSVTNDRAAASSRPDVLAAEAARAKAEAEWRLQHALRVPDPTFFGQYEHAPPDLPNTVGVGISLPLPLWNRNRGAITAARAAADQAVVQAQKVLAQATADIATARVSFAAARTRWQRYRDELTARSRRIRETVAYAYGKGGASLLDLLAAQRNDNEVRLATAQAAADTANALAVWRAVTQGAQPSQVKP